MQLIHEGKVRDLYVAPQSNNILVDVLLYEIGRNLGYSAAERVTVSVCVLVFFWGAFAFVAAASRRPPWLLAPALAMVAYGYTFEMGFLNYYLSIGLAFFGIAAVWQGAFKDWIAAAVIAVLAFLAHPIGLLVMIAFITYVKLSQLTQGWKRWIPPALALAVLIAIHFYILRFQTMVWETPFFRMNGSDQLMLYGRRYYALGLALLAFMVGAIGYGLIRERALYRLIRDEAGGTSASIRIALELWGVLLVSAALIPEVIYMPQYPAPVALLVARSTCISAVLGVCVIGCLQPRRWHMVGFGLGAAILFTWLYQDTGRLNKLEEQGRRMVNAFPYGTRFVVTIGPAIGSRIAYICHILDRACLGRCFTYSNYEPSSGQFWIHSRPGSRTADSNADEILALEFGQYRVKAADLPLKQIYQCSVEDVDRLCIRDLAAGEQNCPNCNNPLYRAMHAAAAKR
ncbi:MAG: hypothetical protein JOZ62_15465 [Acidobacteriaceae bacterium]|nr:hypothetical protein [Acidobacteriaceae bacterium]